MTGTAAALMYHSVCTSPASTDFARFVLAPDLLERHFEFLAGSGAAITTAHELATARRPGRHFALTFDDAYADFADVVVPLLDKYALAATLFVPTGFVGGRAGWLTPLPERDRPVLTWGQLHEIAASGRVEIAAHSHSHPQLDRMTKARIGAEVRASRAILEDELQRPVHSFAYPFGYADRRCWQAVRAAGYASGWAVDEQPLGGRDNRHRLPRVTVDAGTSVARLEELLTRRATPAGAVVAAAKRSAWRMMRRRSPADPAPVPLLAGTPADPERVDVGH